MTELQETEDLEENDELVVWSGDAVRLVLTYDRSFRGLSSTFALPGDDVPPEVMTAAAAVQAAEAERAPLREQLKQELIRDGRTLGPARKQSAKVLAEFDSESELIAALIPDADVAIEEARVALAGAVYAAGGVWDTYLDP
jgi:hypothetical protein